MYLVRLKRSAEKELDAIPVRHQSRILEALKLLGRAPRPHGCVKLTNRNDYRLRIGNYRILYSIDDTEKTVEVAAVGDRRDVYRRR